MIRSQSLSDSMLLDYELPVFLFFFLLRWDQKLGGLEAGVFLPLGQLHSDNTPGLMCVSCFSPVRLFATLWTIVLQAPLSIGFSRHKYWIGLPCLPPRDLPDLGIEPISLMCPALAGGFFSTSTTY